MKTHFNELTPAEHERLAILAEECGEVIQIVGKILRHGYHSTHPNDIDTTNRELLEKELGDLRFIVGLMTNLRDINEGGIVQQAYVKAAKIEKYLHHNSVI